MDETYPERNGRQGQERRVLNVQYRSQYRHYNMGDELLRGRSGLPSI